MIDLSSFATQWEMCTADKRRDLLHCTHESIKETVPRYNELPGWDNDLGDRYTNTEFPELPDWLQKALAVIMQ